MISLVDYEQSCGLAEHGIELLIGHSTWPQHSAQPGLRMVQQLVSSLRRDSSVAQYVALPFRVCVKGAQSEHRGQFTLHCLQYD